MSLTMQIGPAPVQVADAPNGIDDTIGLNNVAAAAAVSGGPFAGNVALRAGLYKTSTGFEAPTGVRLTGAGKNATVIRKTASCDLVSYNGASNTTRNQRGGMSDVRLDGGGFGGKLITAKWADHLNFDRVWCYNNVDTALYLENVWDTYFNNVEFDTCSGADGFKPSVLITSNADDSSNIIVFHGCRWENFVDGALWISGRPPATPYLPQTGSNPPYGIYLTDCKWETPQLRGVVFDTSADVSTVHIDGMYMAVRGLYSGISTGRTLVNIIGAYDIRFRRVRALINGAGKPTADSVFRVFTNANALEIDAVIDAQQNPATAVAVMAGGAPKIDVSRLVARPGQSPTMFSGAWPVAA